LFNGPPIAGSTLRFDRQPGYLFDVNGVKLYQEEILKTSGIPPPSHDRFILVGVLTELETLLGPWLAHLDGTLQGLPRFMGLAVSD